VRRLKGLIFPRNARFLYHAKHDGTEQYWTALARDIRKVSPAYGPALAALQARDGVVPLDQFAIISGSPIRQRGQVSSDTVLQRSEAGLIGARGVGRLPCACQIPGRSVINPLFRHRRACQRWPSDAWAHGATGCDHRDHASIPSDHCSSDQPVIDGRLKPHCGCG
jgi:hypothetical protein